MTLWRGELGDVKMCGEDVMDCNSCSGDVIECDSGEFGDDVIECDSDAFGDACEGDVREVCGDCCGEDRSEVVTGVGREGVLVLVVAVGVFERRKGLAIGVRSGVVPVVIVRVCERVEGEVILGTGVMSELVGTGVAAEDT